MYASIDIEDLESKAENETIGTIRNLLSYDACSTIINELMSFRLDYCTCNSIMYNVPRNKTDRLQE